MKIYITPFYRIAVSTFLLTTFLCACNSSGGGGLDDSSITDSSFAYNNWPNETTTNTSYDDISSKVLISDLNYDGSLENIFISRVRRSTNQKSFMLRVTGSWHFNELTNFTSANAVILKDSIPFSYDFDSNGLKELIFVSYGKNKIYAFEFENKDLSKLSIRWVLKLPKNLPDDFDRKFSLTTVNGQEVLKLDSYAIFEQSNGKPRVRSLSKLSNDRGRDDN